MPMPQIVLFHEVFHTAEHVYIITEVCSADLFDFFDNHPNGVDEETSKMILVNVLKALIYCHDRNYCHRDIKPENILIDYDPVTNVCVNVKLCDFGLAVKFEKKTQLDEFCGSPGFFAPEMVSKGVYYGDKADMWSLGCVMLELILGHEVFCDTWMVAYNYVALQDKVSFSNGVQDALAKLNEHSSSPRRICSSLSKDSIYQSPCSTPRIEVGPGMLMSRGFSEGLISFLFKCLCVRASERTTARRLFNHSWIECEVENCGDTFDIDCTLAVSNSKSYDDLESSMSSPLSSLSIHINTSLGALNPLSNKERKMMEDFNSHHESNEHLHFPPLEPVTPSVSKLRKMLL